MAALAAGRMRLVLAPPAARLLAAAGFSVDGRPGAPLCLTGRHATVFVPFGNLLRLAFLLARVLRLVASGHRGLLRVRDCELLRRAMCKLVAGTGPIRPMGPHRSHQRSSACAAVIASRSATRGPAPG